LPPKVNPELANFGFLAEHDPLLVQIASAAEKACSSGPNTTLIKHREFVNSRFADHGVRQCRCEFIRTIRMPSGGAQINPSHAEPENDE
jgi:hypothetical protein